MPKAFISYSWSSQEHRDTIREWAERLALDGVEIVLDIFDLQEGHDKYAFMERMITDPSVTHVLVFSDSTYAEKADARKAGVGTESQIISREVYEKVAQSKFIPIVCEFTDSRDPCLPAFLKSRIYLDFSSQEAANSNWEKLVRLVYGKPLYQKPSLGKAPAYITEPDSSPASSEASIRLIALRAAVLEDRKSRFAAREAFIDAVVRHADSLRIRSQPSEESFADDVLKSYDALKHDRNLVADWVLFDATSSPGPEFSEPLHDFLERLLGVTGRPPEMQTWKDSWFEAHGLFALETFLYVVAALLKAGAYQLLHQVFTSHYLRPESDRSTTTPFDSFDGFSAASEVLQAKLAPEGRRLYSPAAELFRRHADRMDIPWTSIMQADLLAFMMSMISDDARWYPQTIHYAGHHHVFPFFLRATQHRSFKHLVTVTGIASADALRTKVKAGFELHQVARWTDFHHASFWHMMNMEKLDTLS